MTKIILFIIIILELLKLSSNFSLNDICKIEQDECKGKYNLNLNFTLICEKEKCTNSLFKYQCTVNYCARNYKACDEYKKLNSLFESFKMLRLHQTNSYVKQESEFRNNIKKCPKQENNWQSSDFCLRQKNCSSLYILEKSFRNPSYMIKNIKCLCPPTHSYECNSNHCSLNRKACDYIQTNSFKLNSSIKTCDRVELKKSVLLYRNSHF